MVFSVGDVGSASPRLSAWLLGVLDFPAQNCRLLGLFCLVVAAESAPLHCVPFPNLLGVKFRVLLGL